MAEDDTNSFTRESLPAANVTRIVREALPSTCRLSKDFKETLIESASEFILFVTSEANDICLADKRKMLTVADLVEAFRRLGLESYADSAAEFAEVYIEARKGMKTNSKTK